MDEFGDTDPLLEHSDGDDDDDEVRPQVKAESSQVKAEVWIQAKRISLSCSFLLSRIGLPIPPMWICHIHRESCKPHCPIWLD